MGVPAFFRKLVQRYPMIVSSCIEAYETCGTYSEDPSEPNPNTIGDREFDCLYLDVNGIIHPCFHPEGVEPKDETEIFKNIELYINRLFNIVRPRRLLFIAIDGCAPRAKINQQRMRRYRGAKEAAFSRWIKIWKLKKEENFEEAKAISQKDYLQKHDSNVITPGTAFMDRLGSHLRLFVKKQQREIKAWRDIIIILSDSSVPGEGEHKIFNFIRSQRIEPGYDPNTRHCIYGLDADLLFLSLATHEMYVSVIRERIVDIVKMPNEEDVVMTPHLIGPDKFNFVSIWVLREYLNRDLRDEAFDKKMISFEWDLERAIDDFILLSFSSGNDFLPHLVGFSFGSGSMPQIISVYREHLPLLGYISECGFVDPSKLRSYMIALANYRNRGKDFEKSSLLTILRPSKRSLDIEEEVNFITQNEDPDIEKEPPSRFFEIKEVEADDFKNYPPKIIDKVELSIKTDKDLLKTFYYRDKFDEPNRKNIIKEFIKGMMWTLKYYMHGVPSWEWYYPYHSSPLMSDFEMLKDSDLVGLTDDFRNPGEPYKPFYQLMAVLPPSSAHALPKKLANLMTDPKSPIKKFYPTKFPVEMDGQTVRFLGHPHIQFIDGDFLKKTLDSIDMELTEEEQNRNKFKLTRVFMCKKKPILDQNKQCILNIKDFNIVAQVSLPEGKESENTTEFYLRPKRVPFDKPLSFLLPNVKKPPADVVYLERVESDGTVIDINATKLNLSDYPLEIPGTHTACIWKDRENLINLMKTKGQLPNNFEIKRRN